MSLSPAARRRLTLAAPLIWMAVIFAGSSVPGKRMPMPGRWDKVAHFTEYAVLGFLAARALREKGLAPPRALALAAFACLAWGVTDEIHQSFVPNRSVEAKDALADALGGLAGAALAVSVSRGAGRSRGAPAG